MVLVLRRAVPIRIMVLGRGAVPLVGVGVGVGVGVARVLRGVAVPLVGSRVRVGSRVLGRGIPLIRVRVMILGGESLIGLGSRPLALTRQGGGGEGSGGELAGQEERLGFWR